MIMKKCLHVINRDGSESKYHLQTTKLTTPSIGIRHHAMRNDAYVPLESMGSGGLNVGSVNVRYGGNNYLPKDWTPKLRFTYYSYTNSIPYANPYVIQPQRIQMLNSVTINNPIYLYLRIGDSYGAENWTNVLTLPADTVQATSGAEYRYYSGSSLGYIKVGNWQSGFFNVSNGSHIVDIAIPEAYWGV